MNQNNRLRNTNNQIPNLNPPNPVLNQKPTLPHRNHSRFITTCAHKSAEYVKLNNTLARTTDALLHPVKRMNRNVNRQRLNRPRTATAQPHRRNTDRNSILRTLLASRLRNKHKPHRAANLAVDQLDALSLRTRRTDHKHLPNPAVKRLLFLARLIRVVRSINSVPKVAHKVSDGNLERTNF